jgi:cytochrome b
MNRWDVGVSLAFFSLAALPAYAYADPSGGTLFQILMPALAALWAMWMILASRVRRGLSAVCRKLRGVGRDEPA